MNNLTKNFKIIFLRLILSVATTKIKFILIKIYVRISQSRRSEPGFHGAADFLKLRFSKEVPGFSEMEDLHAQ